MINILITGAKGQVGCELQYWTPQFAHFKFHFVDIDELDITNADAVYQMFNKKKLNYCINCAAFTAVDKAEQNNYIAEAVNVTGAKNLAEACLKTNTRLIHLSTDYVYHNQQNTPFKEGDPTNPQSVYASTKLKGDHSILRILPSSSIIRTSWVYSSYGHNFVKTMIRLGKQRNELKVVFDQIGTPTYARDLAKAILIMIDKVEKKEVPVSSLTGIYHYSNEGVTSWYDFAIAIFRLANLSCKVYPIETKDYPTPAKRPPFSLLNKGKIKSVFGIEIPHWEESLKVCLEALSST